MTTTIASRIYIEDPSKKIVSWAKENLRLPNPEFEKKERMGFWTGRTPKELRLYERNGDTLILPFGVCREIMPMIKDEPLYTDFRQNNVIDYGAPVPLYDYQSVAVEKMKAAKYGILKSTTGSGKTQVGIAVIKALKRRALWLCHTADLLNQSMERALRYMDGGLIGTITEGKVNVGVGVTFATVQTMANLDLTQYRDYWDVVIVDECHRVSSSATSFTRYEKVLNHLSARHKFGLTATPERSDGLIKATFALIGNVIYEVPEEAVADKVTGVRIQTVETETDITDECLNDDGTINYVNLILHLTTDVKRNGLIVEKITECRGHSCLILSERLDQLLCLMARLPWDMMVESVFISGNKVCVPVYDKDGGRLEEKTGKAAKELRAQAIEDMRIGKRKYLFASYSLAKEGLDIPRLDRLFLASPAKFSAIVTQSVGRIRRTFEGKETPLVYDFVDFYIGFCKRAYQERCRSYRKMGAEIMKGMC